MKKLLASLFLVSLMSISLHGAIGYGIRGGVNFSSLGKMNETFGHYQLFGEPDNYFGFHIGGTSLFSFGPVFVQPELLFSSNGSFLRLEDTREEATIEDRVYFRTSFYKVDLPVSIGYSIGPLRFFAGPIYSLMLGKTDDFDPGHLEVSFEQSLNISNFAYQVGAGLGLGNLLLDLKYEGGLTPMGNTVTIGDVTRTFDSRPRQVILSIGLLF